MLYIKNILTPDHEMIDYSLESPFEEVVDAPGLTLLPAAIDPHVRISLSEPSTTVEPWKILVRSALSGGATQLLTHCSPSIHGSQQLKVCKQQLTAQLKAVKIPLQVSPIPKVSADDVGQLPLNRSGTRTVSCSIQQIAHMPAGDADRLFRLASEHNFTLFLWVDPQGDRNHFQRLFHYIEKFHTRSYLYPIENTRTLNIIQAAKLDSLPVDCGIDYLQLIDPSSWKGRGCKDWQLLKKQFSPEFSEALWSAIKKGIISCIGSGHHLRCHQAEARLGSLGTIELLYPFLYTYGTMRGLSLADILNLTRHNAERIFQIPANQDVTLVDLSREKSPSEHFFRTRGRYELYHTLSLTGWPVYTVCEGRIFKLFRKYPSEGPSK